MDEYGKAVLAVVTAYGAGEMDQAEAVAKITQLSIDAINTPRQSGVIDTAVARLMHKAIKPEAATLGNRTVRFAPDPRIEVFCRAYETERVGKSNPPMQARSSATEAANAFFDALYPKQEITA